MYMQIDRFLFNMNKLVNSQVVVNYCYSSDRKGLQITPSIILNLEGNTETLKGLENCVEFYNQAGLRIELLFKEIEKRINSFLKEKNRLILSNEDRKLLEEHNIFIPDEYYIEG